MEDIMIQYQGFHPSDFTKTYLDSKLSELLDQAPYGSSVRAVFSRKNKQLVANVRIMSAAGQFFATAQGMHMREVSRKLGERVRRQLKRWKTIRFQNKRLRDLPVGQEFARQDLAVHDLNDFTEVDPNDSSVA
ncbi:MAG: HPF/RaiA family ribosome-associated protein [Bdellovibrionales bacterium]